MDEYGDFDNRDIYDTDEAAFLTSRLAMRAEEVEANVSGSQFLNSPRNGSTLDAEEDEEANFTPNVLGGPTNDTPLFYGEELDSLIQSQERNVAGNVTTQNIDASEGYALHIDEHEENDDIDNNDVDDDDEGDDDDDDNNNFLIDNYEPPEHTDMASGGSGCEGGGDRTPFALSRVRELLKFHSNSTIVSKDAVTTASEAVVLILQDLTRMAAAQAERNNRKTVRYSDVATVVQHYDRFSFLLDILPPVPEVKKHSSKPVQRQTAIVPTGSKVGQTPRSSQKQQRLQQTGTQRGSHMRQAKLSFGNAADCI
ncbi:hypothetical protein, conserved [Trypanosoma brucei gambiense DAL972]|uniref:Transcription factor CBF/NF-Y/archaeal histone domain-containing protein n=1 Tax=Trypanosoma brucei gambiense (strain MHOM/CI/86/DAL972) TaxID=679716 RepID=C9ZML8_TRYB9|nr:hypothetical protein, conserved [Trypanosoma brucei gambiense DAL972]CBH10521.1 hypothetical protein, conserved [Trypanosoma brucei gambiense DAL972]|eukprot:XP_011772810.1 hypothetical protein, conserved [Trypanosoma brucei gambiense DAL972]